MTTPLPEDSDASVDSSEERVDAGGTTETTGGPPPYSSVVAATEPAMDKPKMGSYANAFTRSTVRVGGTPKFDWSGLEKKGSASPNCARFPFGTKGNTQQYNGAMKHPSDLVLSKRCKLRQMMDIFILYLIDWGMDMMVYTPNPSKPTQMLFIPREFMRLTFAGVLKANGLLKQHWDEYDSTNDMCLIQLLLNACDQEMRDAVAPYIDGDDFTAAALLQLICSKVDSVTPMSWEDRRVEVRSILPKGFVGINIAQWAEKIFSKLQDLERANQLNAAVMTWLFETIVNLEVSRFSDEFRIQYSTLFYQLIEDNDTKANDVLLAILRQHGLCWDQILAEVSAKYQKLVQRTQWHPLNVPKDSGAAPRTHLASSKLDKTQQRIYQALVAAVEKGESVKICYKCGEPGHKQNDPQCPKYEKKSGDKPKDAPKDKNKSSDKKVFDHPAPADGKPPFMIDEATGWFLIYCKKCNRGEGAWQCTHFIHGADRKKNIDRATLFKCKDEFKRTGTVTHEQGKQLLQEHGLYCQPVGTDVAPGINIRL